MSASSRLVGDYVRDLRKVESEVAHVAEAANAAAAAARAGCGQASRDLLRFARAHLELALTAAEPAPKEVA